MPLFVVLLKGVNVGKAKRVPMAEFKDCLLALGCTEVVTLLNSGNAVVVSPARSTLALARRITESLVNHFEFDVPVIVKSKLEFNSAVAGNALNVPEEHFSRLLVAFAQTRQAVCALSPLSDRIVEPERFTVGKHAAYLYCAGGILESQAAKSLLGTIGKGVTTRNWATVLKLHAMVNNGDA